MDVRFGSVLSDALAFGDGFYPDFADTSEKAHHGLSGGVSCNRESVTAKSSSGKPWV
jgi:hypothetical protein